MSKLILILVALLVIASLVLGGCGGAPSETTTMAATTTTATTTTATTTTATTTTPTTTATPTPSPSPTITPTVTPSETPSLTPTETPTPTQTPSATPTPTPLFSLMITDTTNDLFTPNGSPAQGEAYLDIVGLEILSFDTYFLGRMKLNGDLPTQTPDPDIFIEWDILVDLDRLPNTGWNWPLICNDIGPDFMCRLELLDDKYKGTLYDIEDNSWSEISFTINGDTIEWRWDKIPDQPTTFNIVAAARQYGHRGNSNFLQLADKAPNVGHIEYIE